MKPAGCVDQYQITSAGRCSRHCVESYRGRIGIFFVFDKFSIGPFGPNSELFNRRCTEGVGGSDQDFFST